MNGTDITRWCARVAFLATIGSALVGWGLYGRDPGELDGLFTYTLMVMGVGEASNVGKRLSFKKEAVE